MIENLLKETEEKMKKTINAFADELKKVRTGRAHTSMLDSVRVNYYGTPSPLAQVASVSCPDPKSFLIAPWESSILKEIETAIVKSEVGMTPLNDGKVIRLKLPDLTEARRKDLVKNTKKISEDARIAVRMIRRDCNETVKKAFKDKDITEDDQKNLNDKVQKMTDDFIKKIDTISADKEKDIMTI